MHTLKDIKRRVRLLLDQYSENGDIIYIPDTSYADSDLKFNEAVDYIQRKICVTTKKLVGRTSLILKGPTILAPLNPHDAFTISLGKEAFIKIPAGTRTFSFTVGSETGASIKLEVYEFKEGDGSTEKLSAYEFGVPYDLDNLNKQGISLNSATKHTDKFLNIRTVQQMTQAAGYIPAPKPGDAKSGVFLLKIVADENYPAVVFDFAAYENFFSSRELIPERGYATAKLPPDIIELLSVEKYHSGGLESTPLEPSEMKNLIFSKEKQLLTSRVENSGVYHISYYRYPSRIYHDSYEDEEVELDDFCIDALVFGVASLICPTENVAVMARMNAMFEEMMRNLYNSEKSVRRIQNKVYGENSFRLYRKL